jgi:uncharacterized membrane protein
MGEGSAPSSATRPSQRVQFVDLLRGWAVIVMIETHCFNATLSPDLAATDLFAVITYINGLVAPSFLFASGMAYALTAHRKMNEYLSFGRPLFRQLGRLLLILAIGYLLHIPRFEYHHLRYETGQEAWQKFFQVDILHCIAISLLSLQVLLLILRNEKRLYRVAGLLAGGVLVATPLIWGIDFWNSLPPVLAAYLNGLHYSLFPLFPWMTFLLVGALVGHLDVQARSATAPGAESSMMRSTAGIGVGLILISFVLEPFGPLVYPVYNYWLTGPSFVLLRIGIVMTLLYGMFLYEKKKGVSAAAAVTLFGRQSLLVYVMHLMLLYGKVGSSSFVDRIGNTFNYLGASLTTAVLLVTMYGLAWSWERIKRDSPRLKTAIQASVVACGIIVFFLADL